MTLTPLAGYRLLQTYTKTPAPAPQPRLQKYHGNCENAARYFTTRGIQIAVEKYSLPAVPVSRVSAAARRSLSSLRKSLPRAYQVTVESFYFTTGPQVSVPVATEQADSSPSGTGWPPATRCAAAPGAPSLAGGGMTGPDSLNAVAQEATLLVATPPQPQAQEQTGLCQTGFAHGSIRASGTFYSFITAVREIVPGGPCQLHTFRMF